MIDITLTTDQLVSISQKIVNACKENGDTIELSRVFQIIISNMKLLLDYKQDEFVASHGTRYEQG